FLICFNRFHNYVVGEIANINEGGRFSMPERADIREMVQLAMPNATKEEIEAKVNANYNAAVAKRENDLFQTARLYKLFKRKCLITELIVDCTSILFSTIIFGLFLA